jgi:hypothetical protein
LTYSRILSYVHWLEKIYGWKIIHMTSQTLTTALQPPVTPTLDLGPATRNYTASGVTKFASNATVTGDTTDKILGLQVRITSGNGTLGVVNSGGTLISTGTSGNISYAYNAATKLLRLTDTSVGQTATGADFQVVLREVGISGASGSVSVSANLGKPVFRSDNGNYYEFVTSGDPAGQLTTWTQANAGATGSSFLGLSGYLATITSQAENQFLTSTFDSRGWIGARADGNRKWTWVGGPEAGKGFWQGDANGSRVTNEGVDYSNWDPNPAEPNNFTPGEPYAQFTTGGVWNDLADDPSAQADARYRPNGYWVEYGLGNGSAALAGTRDTIILNDGATTTPLDLVFYDPTKGQVSFGFTGTSYSSITTEGADTPVLTRNSDAATPQFGTAWRLISSNVDVDKDGVKDQILAFTATNAIAVLFGEARTGGTRQFAYRNSAFVTLNGAVLAPGTNWNAEFASNKIGASDSPGLFWRANTGEVTIWSLSATTANGQTSVSLANSGVIGSVGVGAWKAIGDGEFNGSIATREVFWTNDVTSQVASWSLVTNRTSRTAKFANGGLVPTATWGVVGISNIAGSGPNDNVIWQSKTTATLIVWNMVDGAYATTGAASSGTPAVLTLTAGDRIKAFADVNNDGVIDFIGQGSDGSIAAYTLTSSYTAGPRIRYTSNNPPYSPAKGGPNGANLDLVNVAQYGA